MYLGLDIGTSGALWSEQNPMDWWEATTSAIKQLDEFKRSGVKAIGLSGQMHGATCLDITAPKIEWMRTYEAENFVKIAKVLLPKDYVRLLMTGDYASDMSDSAGTLWMDVAKRDWSDDVLALTALTREHMPKLFEGSEATGKLRKDIATDWGVPQVPVAAGGGDNAAGAVGSGTTSHGDGFISLGTSGVTFLADDSYRPNPEGAVHTFCHALPGLWHQMSVTLSAASAVDFVAKMTGFTQPADLYAAAEDANQPGKGAYFFRPRRRHRRPPRDGSRN